MKRKDGILCVTPSCDQLVFRIEEADGGIGYGFTNFFLMREDMSMSLFQNSGRDRKVWNIVLLSHEASCRERIFSHMLNLKGAKECVCWLVSKMRQGEFYRAHSIPNFAARC